MNDLISRQDAVESIRECAEAAHNMNDWDMEQGYLNAIECIEEEPSAQPERLTDDDFETIRIHLNAYKEKLCNQHRWKEAEEYQRIIDRFMSFASAQPEHDENDLDFVQPHKRTPVQLVVSSDCISRQEAINAVDELLQIATHEEKHKLSMLRRVLKDVLPSAQPEIIRCKECRYKKLKGVDYYCDHITGEEIMVLPNDYCSWAERGTDG